MTSHQLRVRSTVEGITTPAVPAAKIPEISGSPSESASVSGGSNIHLLRARTVREIKRSAREAEAR